MSITSYMKPCGYLKQETKTHRRNSNHQRKKYWRQHTLHFFMAAL